MAITGLGMASAIGSGVVDACASARAGIFRCGALDGPLLRDASSGDGELPSGCAVPFLEGFEGVARLASLTALALGDLQESGSLEGRARTALYLSGPSGYLLHHADLWAGLPPEHRQEEPLENPRPAGRRGEAGEPPTVGQAMRKTLAERLLPAVLSQAPLEDLVEQRLFLEDSPGFGSAVEAATAALASNRVDRCIVAGADSLVWSEPLEALFHLGMLKGPETPVGIIPGEAAGCLVLERPDRARRRQATVHAFIDATAQGAEEGGTLSWRPHQGKALAGVIGQAMRALPDSGRETGLVIADLNGTEARAVDWGCALARRPPGSSYADAPAWIPAASFGEVGAATGPVATCLAARGFARGYAPSPNALIWLWGDAGRRAAIYVRAPGP